jgi:hypothetical protein
VLNWICPKSVILYASKPAHGAGAQRGAAERSPEAVPA